MGIPEKAVIAGKEILNYIPQRFPIVMVDEFYGITNNVSYSALTVREDNMFTGNGHFNESGIIEHIAQSGALRMRYSSEKRNTTPSLGYIGAIKKMKIFRLPTIGEKLFTSLKIEQEIFNITLLSAEVRVNDKIIASCEMKVFLEKPDEK